ncbi:MAG: hypothetical protein RR623_01265 [Bacilli bacterium]
MQCTPLTNEEVIDKTLELRLEYGDTDEYFYVLQDSEYKILVNKYHCYGDRKLSVEVGMTMLFKMSHTSIRERVGQEERYGKEAFDNFFKLLQKKLKDPTFGYLAPIAYFGGTYSCESEYYAKSPEFTWQPFYRGSHSGTPMWKGKRIYKVNGEIIEPYENNLVFGDGVVDHFIPRDELSNMNNP